MLKSAKEILKERGVDLDKERMEKMRELNENTTSLVQVITEWLEKQPLGTELLVLGVDEVKNTIGFKFYDEKVNNVDGTVKVWHHLDYLKERCFMPDTRLQALGFTVYRPSDNKVYMKYGSYDPYLYVSIPQN